MKSRIASLHVSALDDSRPLPPDLEQLIEATAARMQAGEAVDLEQLISATRNMRISCVSYCRQWSCS